MNLLVLVFGVVLDTMSKELIPHQLIEIVPKGAIVFGIEKLLAEGAIID
jgi:hypothetical protein